MVCGLFALAIFLLELAELVVIASEALERWARQSNSGQRWTIYAFTAQY